MYSNMTAAMTCILWVLMEGGPWPDHKGGTGLMCLFSCSGNISVKNFDHGCSINTEFQCSSAALTSSTRMGCQKRPLTYWRVVCEQALLIRASPHHSGVALWSWQQILWLSLHTRHWDIIHHIMRIMDITLTCDNSDHWDVGALFFDPRRYSPARSWLTGHIMCVRSHRD